MAELHPLAGVYAAALTPLTIDQQPDLRGVANLLDFLAERGCHGALLMGTTGEGPSFSPKERAAVWQAAAEWRRGHAAFRLLAGTGTPSLGETIELTRLAFELDFEAVVVLPPYFFRNAPEDGLFEWFSTVIEEAVPRDKYLLGYHIPAVSGVALPLSLLQRIGEAFPQQFGGLKDSSGELESARNYVEGLPGKAVLVGNDKLIGPGLELGAAGCITALANLRSPEARAIFDAYGAGQATEAMQQALDAFRECLDAAPPPPAYLKAMIHRQYGLPLWPVRPPLLDFTAEQTQAAAEALAAAETQDG